MVVVIFGEWRCLFDLCLDDIVGFRYKSFVNESRCDFKYLTSRGTIYCLVIRLTDGQDTNDFQKLCSLCHCNLHYLKFIQPK